MMDSGVAVSEVEKVLVEDKILANDLNPKAWMVRPCEWYKEELNDCTSIKARFHQYFIHGKSVSCDNWKADYDNCMSYRKTKDTKFLNLVVDSEVERYQDRMKATLRNDVWERRETPPSTWNSELPEWCLKQQEHSLFNQQMPSNNNNNTTTTTSCSIQ